MIQNQFSDMFGFDSTTDFFEFLNIVRKFLLSFALNKISKFEFSKNRSKS